MLITPVGLSKTGIVKEFGYISRVHDAATPFNFASCDFGVADATRVIIVGLTVYSSGAPTLTSVKIGGVTATIVESTNVDGAEMRVAFAYATVPTGTTGSVNVASDADECDIAWWRSVGYNATPTAHANDITLTSSTTLSATLVIPTGGFGLGYTAIDGSSGVTPTVTWTNLSERFDLRPVTADNREAHSGADSVTAGSATRTMTASGSCDRGALILSAWGP